MKLNTLKHVETTCSHSFKDSCFMLICADIHIRWKPLPSALVHAEMVRLKRKTESFPSSFTRWSNTRASCATRSRYAQVTTYGGLLKQTNPWKCPLVFLDAKTIVISYHIYVCCFQWCSKLFKALLVLIIEKTNIMIAGKSIMTCTILHGMTVSTSLSDRSTINVNPCAHDRHPLSLHFNTKLCILTRFLQYLAVLSGYLASGETRNWNYEAQTLLNRLSIETWKPLCYCVDSTS